MSEIKESIEGIKHLLHTLTDAIKRDSENHQKQENILKELMERQEKLENIRTRKGLFDGDEVDVKDFGGKFQVQDLNKLLEVKSTNEMIVKFQEANDDILVVSQLLGINPRETNIYHKYLKTDPILFKAMYTGGSGSGLEWIPTGYSRQMYDMVHLNLKVAALHDSIDMPTNPYISPVVSSDLIGYAVTEQSTDDAELTASNRIASSTSGTAKLTLNAKKIGARTTFSEEMSEDSIVPVLPMLKQNITRALAASVETAIINGDTSSTHLDSDTTATNDVRKLFLGYRRAASVCGATSSLATLNGESFTDLRATMKKYGVNPANLAVVTSALGYMKMLNMRDNTVSGAPIVTTLDKYGPSATVLSGELGKIYGMPVIVSEYCRQDLNASGVYDTTTTTKTIIMIVFRPGFVIGNRRGLTLKSEEIIVTDQVRLVATMRAAFSNVYTLSSTNPVVALGYNIG